MAQDLLQRLLCKDPKKRLGAGPQGAQEVKNHPFFQVRPLSCPPHLSAHAWSRLLLWKDALRLADFT